LFTIREGVTIGKLSEKLTKFGLSLRTECARVRKDEKREGQERRDGKNKPLLFQVRASFLVLGLGRNGGKEKEESEGNRGKITTK
jgi:hypothetical protein